MPVSRSWIPAYLIAVLIWGLSFAFNKIALESFSPVQVSASRIILGALTLIAIVLIARTPWRIPRRYWSHVALLGITLTAIPFTLIVFAQSRITSILAGLLNASTPLWAALFVLLLIPAERSSRQQVAGLLLGAAGIAVLVGVWNLGTVDLVGAGAMLLANAFYGFGSAWSRWQLTDADVPGNVMTAGQLTASALVMAPLLLWSGPPAGPQPVSVGPVVSVLMLGVFGAGVAFLLYWRILKEAGAVTAATVTYMIPLVSTSVGIIVLDEPLTWNEPVGALIVLAGVLLAQLRPAGGRVTPGAAGRS